MQNILNNFCGHDFFNYTYEFNSILLSSFLLLYFSYCIHINKKNLKKNVYNESSSSEFESP